jgi:predicted dehydrogenase
MSDVWRCGVSGLGVGEQHALAYRQDARCRLTSLLDVDPAKLRDVSSRFPGVYTFKAWEDLLDGERLDILSVASPENVHSDQIVSALEKGWHVFAEKPLCQTREEIRAIRKSVEANEKLILTNLVLRAAPAFRELRRLIADGELGQVYAFDGDYLYGRLWKITEGWRGHIPYYSVMQGGGVHLIDLMHWCIGEKPVSVQTHGNKVCTVGTSFRHHDMQSATFLFRSGIIGRITANFGCVARHQHVVRVFGTKATFISDESGPRLITDRDGKMRTLSDFSALPSGKGALLPEFLDLVGRKTSDWKDSMDSHFATMSVCLASDESARAGGERVEIIYE